jgi:hypothetical protein
MLFRMKSGSRHLLTPQRAYDLLLERIPEHKIYGEKADPQDRCICTEYEGQLYLDLIPAIPEPAESKTRILTPNHDRTEWQSTDPKGYLRWFRSRQVTKWTKDLA